MRQDIFDSYSKIKQNGPTKSEFNTLLSVVNSLKKKVDSLMEINQRLLDIINTHEWEKVEEVMEKNNKK